MLLTHAVLSTRHDTILPSATTAAINNQAAYSGGPEPMQTNTVRENYASKCKDVRNLTHWLTCDTLLVPTKETMSFQLRPNLQTDARIMWTWLRS